MIEGGTSLVSTVNQRRLRGMNPSLYYPLYNMGDRPLLVLRDFNEIVDLREKIGGCSRSKQQMATFSSYALLA